MATHITQKFSKNASTTDLFIDEDASIFGFDQFSHPYRAQYSALDQGEAISYNFYNWLPIDGSPRNNYSESSVKYNFGPKLDQYLNYLDTQVNSIQLSLIINETIDTIEEDQFFLFDSTNKINIRRFVLALIYLSDPRNKYSGYLIYNIENSYNNSGDHSTNLIPNMFHQAYQFNKRFRESFGKTPLEMITGEDSPVQPDPDPIIDNIVFDGEVKYVEMDTNFYALVSSTGNNYVPKVALDSEFQQDGLKVVVQGDVVKDKILNNFGEEISIDSIVKTENDNDDDTVIEEEEITLASILNKIKALEIQLQVVQRGFIGGNKSRFY